MTGERRPSRGNRRDVIFLWEDTLWQRPQDQLLAGYVSEAAAHNARVRGARTGYAAQGFRHLADLDLGAGATTIVRAFARRPDAGSASSAATPSPSSAPTGPSSTGRMMAAQMLGAIPVPVYAGRGRRRDGLRARPRRGALRRGRGPGAGRQDPVGRRIACRSSSEMIYDEPRGLRDYDHSRLHAIDDVHRGRPQGARRRSGAAAWLDAEIAAGKGTRSVASCSTRRARPGSSKGVVLTARALDRGRARYGSLRQSDRERRGARLSAARLGRRPLSQLRAGAWSPASAWPARKAPTRSMRGPARDRPDLLFRAAARVRESAHAHDDPHGGCQQPQAQACSTISSASRGAAASRSSTASRVPLERRLLYGIGNVLVYGPLKNVLGFSRVRVAYTAGEAIGPELFAFYRSLGINLKQLYGQTEAFRLCHRAARRRDLFRHRRPGRARTSRSASPTTARCCSSRPGMFIGYFKDPEKTAEAMTPDGCVHTGDAGFFDERPGT